MKHTFEPQTSLHSERAKAHMVTHVPKATLHETVGDVLSRLQDPKAYFDTVDYTYVLDKNGVLGGVVSMKELLNAKDSQHISTLVKTKLATVHPHTDQEHVAMLAIKQNIKAIPVVDKEHHFLGVVPSDTILDILHWEHVEDVLRMSGIHGKSDQFRTIIKSGFLKISKLRIPSLLIGLLGGLFTTSVVGYFEGSLEKNLLLAFFIPVIVYMSAAVGNQSQTILIRTLATTPVKMTLYFWREILAGTLIGSLLGSVMFLIVLLWHKSFHVALTIGISMVLTIIVATTVAVSITWILNKLKKDPAIAGGPYATVIQDILSLLIYFSVAAMVLS